MRVLIRTLVVVSLVMIGAVGCSSTSVQRLDKTNYALTIQEESIVGDPFISHTKGYVLTHKQWMGALHHPQWKITYEYSEDYFKQELIYAGKSGGSIKVNYREFRGASTRPSLYAAPAFYQSLTYDLNESPIIQFKKFRIRVISADNQKITYIVLSDRG